MDITKLEALLTKGQDNALLRYSLGTAYLKQKDFTQAIEHLAKSITFDPLYSAAWKSYGKALAENQQISEAIEAYTQGIQVAEQKGDIQAVKEMKVFLKRLQQTS